MSLIIDALKKAQQLQLKGHEGTPILKYPHPDNKKRRNNKKQWIFIGAGLVICCIVLFILLKPASPPLATQTNRAIIPMERIQSGAVLKKEEPTEGEHYEEVALSGHPYSNHLTKKISQEPLKKFASLSKTKESMPAKQAPNPVNNETVSVQTATGDLSYRETPLSIHNSHPNSLPLPQTSQKEEVSPRSVEVEHEGGKDRTMITDVLNYFNSGVHFYNQKEFSKAIQAYQKVIELDPNYVEAYNNLGITYQMIGDMDNAFKSYEKAIEINPKYEKGYNNLGTLLLLENRYNEALKTFQKALTINSNNIESHINLGILFKKRGQLEKAIESYQTALTLDPFHRETHYNIALLYEQMKNFELAINHYQQFIQLSSKSHPELVTRVQRHLNEFIRVRGNKGQ
jgi:tetratricopeptide (TPR) repeat protein